LKEIHLFEFIPLRSSGISGTTALQRTIGAVVPMIPSLRDGIN
jgi:hypothetical protein